MLRLLTAAVLLATQQSFTVKPDLQIGAVNGAGSFSSAAAVAVSSKDEIFVADGMDKRIKVFDAKGKYLRSIGRAGSGPGDLQSPKMLRLIGDTLWVAEYSGRTTFFNASTGRTLSVLEVPGSIGNADASGFSTQHGMFHLAAPSMIHRENQNLTFVRHLPGRKFQTLMEVPRRNAVLTVLNDGRPVYGSTQPFTDDPIATVSADGQHAIVVTFPAPARDGTASFVVTKYDLLKASGKQPPPVILQKRVPYRAELLTEEHIDRYFKARAGQDNGPYFPKDGDAAIRKALYRPKWLRPMSSVKMGTDGSIWLRKRGRSSEPAHWTILNPDLTVRGNVLIQPDLGYVVGIARDHVWLVKYDEEEVPFVVRARLVRK